MAESDSEPQEPADLEIEKHLPWIQALARKFHPNDFDDCVQEGLIALLRCSRTWDASLGLTLRAHATKRVMGAMVDLARKGPRGRTGRRQRRYVDATASLEASPYVAEWVALQAERDCSTQQDERDQIGRTWFAMRDGKKRRLVLRRCRHCAVAFEARADRHPPPVYCSNACQHGDRTGRQRAGCLRCGLTYAEVDRRAERRRGLMIAAPLGQHVAGPTGQRATRNRE